MKKIVCVSVCVARARAFPQKKPGKKFPRPVVTAAVTKVKQKVDSSRRPCVGEACAHQRRRTEQCQSSACLLAHSPPLTECATKQAKVASAPHRSRCCAQCQRKIRICLSVEAIEARARKREVQGLEHRTNCETKAEAGCNPWLCSASSRCRGRSASRATSCPLTHARVRQAIFGGSQVPE